jgi:GH43 family beta-xylosidase
VTTAVVALLAGNVADPAAAASGVDLGGLDAPDPALVREGDGWLVFSTSAHGAEVPVHRVAVDGTSAYLGDAMPTLGAWATTGKTWAPSVTYLDGRWRLHYAATDGASGRQCIGVAVADSATGPYVDANEDPLVCQTDRGGSIDPSVTIASDGRAYIHWKSEDNAIGRSATLWGAELSPDGMTLASTPVRLLRADRRWEHGIIENPSMVQTQGGWTLFYSGGQWWDASYGTGYATCRGPLGPCTKRTTRSALWSSDAGRVGAGGASFVVTGPNEAMIAEHAWTYGAVGYDTGGVRSTTLSTVTFAGGRPR